ncbi:glycosyltransferase family 2 protein [Cytobacillus sp. FSL R7-0696]|uniref:glycosyltransferase family 2 protein n=1 Tax=Cytobacillus TaxID=2675230 RepID=UPI0030F5D819
MTVPSISVILPVYNVEKYVDECFDSLLHQTIGFENLEIIFIDDCSTDSTASILQSYVDKYTNVKVIRLEVNSGAPGKPRNVGINYALGKYSIFLDPDDFLPKNAYEILYNNAEKYESEFVMGKMESFRDSDPKRKTWLHITFRDYLMKKSYYNVNIKMVPFFLQVKTGVYLKLVKTEFIKKNNLSFIEGMKNGEDKIYDMMLFTKAEKFTYIPETVYMYRTRDDDENLSMTQQDLESTILNDCKAALNIRPLLKEDEYKYFQINALRSIFWKLLDPAFNSLSKKKRQELLLEISYVMVSYDSNLIKKYFTLEYPIVSLLQKGEINHAMNYIQIHVSRKYWYTETNALKKQYDRQVGFLQSKSWKLTKTLRLINQKRRNLFRNINFKKYKIQER